MIALAIASATESRASANDVSGDDAEVWVLEMSENGGVWFRPMQRRQMIASGMALLTTMCLPTGPTVLREEQAGALEAFTTMFGELRRMGQRVPPRYVLPSLVSHTYTVRDMAKDAAPRTRIHDRTASDRVRGLAAQREAQGHALSCAATECLRALDRSTELLSRAVDEQCAPVVARPSPTRPR